MNFAKTGSVLYVFWGLLHIAAAIQGFQLGASLEPGLVQGKINQGAWDLLFIALAAISISVIYNWNNSLLGYLLNLLIVSIADIGFIIFVLIPGHVDLFPGILGPVFWISAVIFSTLGIRRK
ncbi:MAG: hypothetical protein PVJ21_11215 [Anaerolineales bacterium]|jgi:hypothetical protein